MQVWIDVLLSAGVSVDRCAVVQIFEEDYLSLSDIGSPRKAKVSPPRKRTKHSPKGRSSDASDTESIPDRKRHKSRQAPNVKSLPCAKETQAVNGQKHNTSVVGPQTDDGMYSRKKGRTRSENGQIKGSKTRKSRKTKENRRPVPISKTSGSTIVLSD